MHGIMQKDDLPLRILKWSSGRGGWQCCCVSWTMSFLNTALPGHLDVVHNRYAVSPAWLFFLYSWLRDTYSLEPLRLPSTTVYILTADLGTFRSGYIFYLAKLVPNLKEVNLAHLALLSSFLFIFLATHSHIQLYTRWWFHISASFKGALNSNRIVPHLWTFPSATTSLSLSLSLSLFHLHGKDTQEFIR